MSGEHMQTKIVDISKLDGKALDWAVGKAEGLENCINLTQGSQTLILDAEIYAPSSNWAQCGPLLEKNCIELVIGEDDYIARRCMTNKYEGTNSWFGHTMLVAACRAIVGEKFGYLVEVPACLVDV